MQDDIIKSIAAGHDTLGLLPTGGGKSITFQVPVLARDGICIVITPLIALMKDQVENLKKRDIKAIAIYSGLTSYEINMFYDNCIFGNVKFLYISPERIGTELFRIKVQEMNVNLIAIDEAHCISQWGYDFRPSYLKIVNLKELLPDIPVLALTATATPEVVDDIQDKLGFKKKNVFQKSFERKNLVYVVKETDDKEKYLLKIINNVRGTGIVYVRNRKKTREISDLLRKNKISSDYYHAGLKNETKDIRQNNWKKGKTRVIVSTNAFGMGIDKSDVRFVIHMDLPDSIEAYFQEAGRGGRDEKKAYAVLLYHKSDRIKLEKRVDTNFPEIKIIKRVYQALGNYYNIAIGAGKNNVYDFKIADFASTYKLEILKVYSSLKILQKEGYIEVTEEINNPSKIHFLVDKHELYKYQVANINVDNFIKLLLRSYTGVFNEYVPIDENSLALKSKIPVDTIIKYLQKLNNSKIIRYIPRKRTPLIIYTEERLDEKSLLISQENYKFRKENFIEKIENVINYASSTAKCRSQILLSYFGDKNPNRCGQCDICLKRNELGLSKYEFDLILKKLKELLRNNSYTIDEIMQTITLKEEKVIKVIQWLLDNNKIKYLDDKKLEWA